MLNTYLTSRVKRKHYKCVSNRNNLNETYILGNVLRAETTKVLHITLFPLLMVHNNICATAISCKNIYKHCTRYPNCTEDCIWKLKSCYKKTDAGRYCYTQTAEVIIYVTVLQQKRTKKTYQISHLSQRPWPSAPASAAAKPTLRFSASWRNAQRQSSGFGRTSSPCAERR